VPPDLRNRALALAGAGLMFTQGAGFAPWGLAGQYLPVTVAIPLAAAAGVVAATILRPRRAAAGLLHGELAAKRPEDLPG
jgi:hypothetical protein